MSVRRLAEVQPPSFAFTPENEAWVKTQLAKYPPGRQASAVIALLWRAQAQNDNWLPKPAIEKVADMLAIPYIRALEIATFYSMFNLEPVGAHFVQLCGTTPCALRGAEALKRICVERIGGERHVSADGKFAWAEVECLGACCNAPMVQINDDYYEDLTPESFNKLLDDLAAGRPVKKGSQIGRVTSEPEPGRATTLSDASLYDGSMLGSWRKRFDEEAAAAAAKAEADKAAANQPAPPPGAAKPAPAPTAPVAPKGVADAPARIEADKAASPVAASPPQAPMAPASAASASESLPPAAPAEAKDEIEPSSGLKGPLTAQQVAAEETAIAARLVSLPPDASQEQKADAVGERPQGLAAPRGGKADDLKRIRGIGKINEGRLNSLGIFHFDQVASWTRPQVMWVGTYLSFPGRIDRENWVEQAKALAAGGPEPKTD